MTLSSFIQRSGMPICLPRRGSGNRGEAFPRVTTWAGSRTGSSRGSATGWRDDQQGGGRQACFRASGGRSWPAVAPDRAQLLGLIGIHHLAGLAATQM